MKCARSGCNVLVTRKQEQTNRARRAQLGERGPYCSRACYFLDQKAHHPWLPLKQQVADAPPT